MTKKKEERKLQANDIVINGLYRNIEDNNEYKLIRVDNENNAILESIKYGGPIVINLKEMFERVDPGNTENYSTIQKYKFKFLGHIINPK